jgi:hypothetical protein
VSVRLRDALVLGGIVASFGAGCGGGGVGAKALSEQAMSLRSEAAEGALLAQDVSSGRTTRVYTREHAADLYKAASRVEASLKSARTKPRLAGKLRRLLVVATRVSAELNRLRTVSKGEARELGRELAAAAAESEEIGKGLG